MQTGVRNTFLWQLAGSLVATLVILASVGELLWWSLYLSEPINVTRFWTILIHSSAAVAIVSLIAYHKGRTAREAAFAGHAPPDWNDAEAGFELRLFSYPVHVQWAFAAIIVVVALFAGTQGFLVRCVLMIFGVVLHELGHALASTRMGRRDVRITLHGFGGHTTSRGFARRQSEALIILAGPALGLLAGLLVIGAGVMFEEVRRNRAYADAWFVTVGWSLFNLLPILPLDGSHLVGLAVRKDSITRLVSVLTCLTGITLCAFLRREELVAWFAALLLGNVLTFPRVAATIERLNQRWG